MLVGAGAAHHRRDGAISHLGPGARRRGFFINHPRPWLGEPRAPLRELGSWDARSMQARFPVVQKFAGPKLVPAVYRLLLGGSPMFGVVPRAAAFA